MVESYLTTDIIVIIVLIVVLIFVGILAFLIHFYWTKIGVAEIWNTARWSSMRSSLYQSVRRRLSRTSGSKMSMERPLSGVSVYSDDKDNESEPYYTQQRKPSSVITSYINPSNVPPVSRPVPVNPVPTIAYNNSSRVNYGTKIGQPMENTKIHHINEYDHSYYDRSGPVQKQRF